MGENRDGYSGKRKGKEAVRPKAEEWHAPAGVFFNNSG